MRIKPVLTLSSVLPLFLMACAPDTPPAAFADDSWRGQQGFAAYLRSFDEIRYKVFVAAEEGAWAYRTRETFDSALQEAMKACRDRVTVVNNTGGCRVYAVGSTIVWDMPEKERLKYIKAYSQDPLADYSLLHSNGLP